MSIKMYEPHQHCRSGKLFSVDGALLGGGVCEVMPGNLPWWWECVWSRLFHQHCSGAATLTREGSVVGGELPSCLPVAVLPFFPMHPARYRPSAHIQQAVSSQRQGTSAL